MMEIKNEEKESRQGGEINSWYKIGKHYTVELLSHYEAAKGLRIIWVG